MREFRTVFLTGALFYALITRARWPKVRAFSAQPLVVGLLLGMSFVSLIALWQFATGQGRIDVEGVGRVRAFYGSPNNLALVLDRVVPIGLALAAFGVSRNRRSVERLFYALATLIMAAACIVTYSKGALLLGLPVGVATVLLAGVRRGRQTLADLDARRVAFRRGARSSSIDADAALRRSREPDQRHGVLPDQAVAKCVAHGAGSPGAGGRAGQLPLCLSYALCVAERMAGVESQPSTQPHPRSCHADWAFWGSSPARGR